MMKWKRFLVCILTAVILTGQAVAVHAEETGGETAQTEQTQNEGEQTEEEKAHAAEEAEKAASYATAPDSNQIPGWPAGPQIYAASGIVMDMNSGAVLYAKKPDEKHYPASITKLLSVLVALNHAQMTDKVTFSDASVAFLQWNDAQIGMRPGEELSMENALYGMLLASANEVSYAVAENVGNQYLGGGYDAFIREMNRTAEELGCTGSNWVNANGLHDENHYTTAHDMALIASAVYKKDDFRRLEATLEQRIPPTNLVNEERILDQNHKMLWAENYYYYPYAKAGKTGYTDQAKTTLVTMADNGELQLAAVVLYTYGVDAYTDTRSMYDYAFDNFRKITLKDVEDTGEIEAFTDENAYVVVPKDIEFSQLERNITVPDNAAINNTVSDNITSDNAASNNTVSNNGAASKTARITYLYQGQCAGTAEVILTDTAYEALTGVKVVSGEEQNDGKAVSFDVKKGGQDAGEASEQTESESRTSKKLSKIIIFIILVLLVTAVYIFVFIKLYRKMTNKPGKRSSSRSTSRGSRRNKKRGGRRKY